MIINHNLPAMNTHRQIGINNNNAAKGMERLSSGLRINRAADDAAGLSISEKMRGQIRGMEQAQRNAQDGVSLVQTAEGALTEVSAILVRMKELMVQSENGTYNDKDIENIEKELTALRDEITNISEKTKFNDKNLLNVGGAKSTVYEFSGGTLADGDTINDGTNDYTVTIVDGVITGINDGTNDLTADEINALITAGGLETGDVATGGGDALTLTATEVTAPPSFTSNLTAGSHTVTDADGIEYEVTVEADGKISGVTKDDGAGGNEDVDPADFAQLKGLVDGDGNAVKVKAEGSIDIQINHGTGDKMTINLVDISNLDTADLEAVNAAIDTVAGFRADLGAIQNRLEHTINNLGTTTENLQAAESRIRDTDMAKEMVELTKNNILLQASQAMLAQANQQPQGVLQLLR